MGTPPENILHGLAYIKRRYGTIEEVNGTGKKSGAPKPGGLKKPTPGGMKPPSTGGKVVGKPNVHK